MFTYNLGRNETSLSFVFFDMQAFLLKYTEHTENWLAFKNILRLHPCSATYFRYQKVNRTLISIS